jgi:DNA-binding response OmpR family regulator
MPARILIIEDDSDIARIIAVNLADLGAETRVIGNGLDGLRAASGRGWDLVILDLMLPGLDGIEVCRRLRAQPAYTPILMLTARSTEADRVLGLELGADDYLTKPFSVRELQARVRAILRRVAMLREADAGALAPIRHVDLELDPARRSVRVRGETLELTAREFDLLHHFARHPGRVFSRAQLLDAVWGHGHDGYEHTVNSHINRLRAKLEADPTRPRYIHTVWGVGYRFDEVD